MRKVCLLLVALWSLNGELFGQIITSPGSDNFLEKTIETLAENSEEEVDYTNIFENLTFYLDHPLELNTASADELQQLLLLDEFQINALLKHRDEFGKLLSIYELQAVTGFDLPLIYQLLPYVKVSRELNRLNISVKEMVKYASQEFFFRVSQQIEQQKGFSPISEEELEANPNARFLGSPQRIFSRYRFRYGNYLSMGFTGEKDSGEEFFRGSQRQGFDFMSGHIAIQNIGKLKSLNIGDFQAQFGQGLTFWSGFAFGKTADAMNVKRTGQGLRPYTSVNENLFLRGIGNAWKLGNYEITVFGSDKRVNTNVADVDSLTEEIQIFSNFNLSGFHRTPNELLKRQNIREQIYGGHVSYKKRALNVGFTAVKSQYSAPIQRSPQAYNQFEFSGSENLNLGVDYNFVWRNFNVFGETSRSANGGLATINGLIASLDPRFALSVLYRSFAKDYHAVYTAAIGEASRNINENGLYLGFRAQLHKSVSLAAYLDRFDYPWLKFRVDGPSRGYDGLAQINYTPSRSLDMYFRYRDRNRPRNTSFEDDEILIDFPVGLHQRNFRYDVSYKISKSFKFRNRVEYVLFQNPGQVLEQGYVILHDVFYKPLGKPITFSFRYSIFDTDGFDSRLYAYENDVLYSFSIPALSGRGTRTYLNFQYSPTNNIDIWFRYAQFFYYDRNVVGSALTETQGPLRSDFRVQVRFKF